MRNKNAVDIERALDSLEKGLESPEAGDSARQAFLLRLVQCSRDLLEHTKAKEDISRLVKNAKFALSGLPPSDDRERIEDIVSQAETGLELLGQRSMLDSIFEAVPGATAILNEKGALPAIGKTYVPRAVYDKCNISQRQIRTLEILPGDPAEDIACRLHVATLDVKTNYEVCLQLLSQSTIY